MKIKKLGAFVLAAGMMLSSMTVSAAGIHYYDRSDPNKPSDWFDKDGGYYKVYPAEYDNAVEFHGWEVPSSSNISGLKGPKKGDVWVDYGAPDDADNDYYVYDGTNWIGKDGTIYKEKPPTTSSSSKSKKSKKSKSNKTEDDGPRPLTQKDIEDIASQAETAALQSVAAGEGFTDIADMQKAAAKNMSAGEYFNNAVVETPGIENTIPVAQGGGIIIDGVATNVMATISKVDIAFVDSARASQEGTVLNVVDVQFPAMAATINFYMPGVAADMNIAAVQYADDVWADVEVAEVRADHVVLNLKQNGKVAFIAK